MSKALKRLGTTLLIIGIALVIGMFFVKFPVATQVPYQVQAPYEAQVPYQVEVPYNDTVTQSQILDHRETYQIQTGHYAYSKFDLEAGVDNSVSVYITNPSQFSSASLLGFPTSSLSRQVAVQSGILSYQIPSAGTYYVIINPYVSDVNVASYKSELQWQEQVTKYRNETQYKTETQYRNETHYKTENIYTSNTLGINIGIALLVFGSIVTGLSFFNLKPITLNPKKLNTVTCAYCGSTYKKKIERCPHCGARKNTYFS
jgi:hypothetical protein